MISVCMSIRIYRNGVFTQQQLNYHKSIRLATHFFGYNQKKNYFCCDKKGMLEGIMLQPYLYTGISVELASEIGF